MISIEQVKLLESRVVKTIEYVDKLTEENTLLKGKLDGCQKRVAELEVSLQRFKEEQGKIEESILSALNRLNKFEDEMDRGLSPKIKTPSAAPKAAPSASSAASAVSAPSAPQSHTVPSASATVAAAAQPAPPAAGVLKPPVFTEEDEDVEIEEDEEEGAAAEEGGELQIF